jgi:hypothetical protein
MFLLLQGAGFTIECSEVMNQHNEQARFLWITARSAADAAT